jgi:hypothetical protein
MEENERLQSFNASLHNQLAEKELICSKLQKEINDSRSSDVDRADDEMHLKSLNDMKRRFQSLIDTYEASNTELEEELKLKIETLSKVEIERDNIAAKLVIQENTNKRMHDECLDLRSASFTREQRIVRLKNVISSLNSKLKIEMSEIRRTAYDVSDLMKFLVQNNLRENKKINTLVTDAISSAFSETLSRESLAVHDVQVLLLNEHKKKETKLSESFSNELRKQKEIHEIEVENIKNDLVSQFDQTVFFGTRFNQSSVANSPSKGILNSNEKYHITLILILKSIIDSLVTLDLLDEKSASKVMDQISNFCKGEDDTTSTPGLFANSISNLVRDSVKISILAKQTENISIEKLKEELKLERISLTRLNEQLSVLSNENSKLSQINDACRNNLEKVNREFSALKEIMAIENESQIQNLKEKMYDMEREHDSALQTVKIEYIQKEAALKLRLDEMISASKDNNNSTIAVLEAKLKSEGTKRQSLQNRILAEEAAHRKAVTELEQRNGDLLRRLETAELELTKLKIESLHT